MGSIFTLVVLLSLYICLQTNMRIFQVPACVEGECPFQKLNSGCSTYSVVIPGNISSESSQWQHFRGFWEGDKDSEIIVPTKRVYKLGMRTRTMTSTNVPGLDIKNQKDRTQEALFVCVLIVHRLNRAMDQ